MTYFYYQQQGMEKPELKTFGLLKSIISKIINFTATSSSSQVTLGLTAVIAIFIHYTIFQHGFDTIYSTKTPQLCNNNNNKALYF